MKMQLPPKLYLGTMTFGWSGQTSSFVDESVAFEMTKRFVDYSIHQQSLSSSSSNTYNCHIDTARIYSGGKSETMVGKTVQKLNSKNQYKSMLIQQQDFLTIGTKAHPSQPMGLSKLGIQQQINLSLDAMNLSSVGEYYLHQPDTEHSLLESLECIHELVLQGKIKRFGMSNYHVSEMKRTFELCSENDLTKPTVYQGLYNPLNRLVENDLIPLLHNNGCSFVAYNPLAAGLLTGKHKKTSDGSVLKGRFKDNQNYLPRFYTDANFQALNIIQEACEKSNISLIEATFKWLLRHSSLTEEDGVLLGASSVSQMEENLNACSMIRSSNLPDEVLQAFDDAWVITKENAFPYWRSYSLDMPERESLDQGASYSAIKK